MKKILFNDIYRLTQAVLNGKKTQTRRIATMQQMRIVLNHPKYSDYTLDELAESCRESAALRKFAPYKIGEVVAVAQSYQTIFDEQGTLHNKWLCDIPLNHAGWHNKMFTCADLMPHHIRITNIRVERLQDISDEDCLAEGVIRCETPTCHKNYCTRDCDDCAKSPREAYSALIDKVSGKGTWESNPYVFVYEFVKVD